MGSVVEITQPVYERREDGQLVIEREDWIGILLPEGDAETRQQATEALQRYAVEEKGWDAYPGSAGASGPYAYVWRHGVLVRAVRWAPGDQEAGRYWRCTLGVGMVGESEPPIDFGDPLEL
jgi:hypothetical protein